MKKALNKLKQIWINFFKQEDDPQQGIPYQIFGPGIMVADADDIIRVARKQFEAAKYLIGKRIEF